MTEKQKTHWSTSAIVGAISAVVVLAVLAGLAIHYRSSISCWLNNKCGTKPETHQPAEKRVSASHPAPAKSGKKTK